MISCDPRQNLHLGGKKHHRHGSVIEEIEGLIKVHNNGHVERPPIVPNVTPTLPPELCVTSKDVMLHNPSNLWSRFYVPTFPSSKKLPLLVYFHGGGFCVGSSAWKCYHDFLAKLATRIGSVIMSINYRLAPEHRLPAAYDDGVQSIMWLTQQAIRNSNDQSWWSSKCDFSKLFLCGDSAGANIAYHVANKLSSCDLKPMSLKGLILIQPFFGGESRTFTEKHSIQPAYSALSLSASDTFWRLSLPIGCNRDHPWCNARLSKNLRLPRTLICVSETDILRDRNLEMCSGLAGAGIKVEKHVYKGVGHAFQILHNSPLSQTRTHELMSHLKAFVHGH